jgi:murein DD-endopeptidase MepM/ murein hydrolase activator NlpD
MDSLGVKAGDMVDMSQEIGKVGSTGFSTGAHLHFGMSVNNVFINPTTVIDTGLLNERKG